MRNALDAAPSVAAAAPPGADPAWRQALALFARPQKLTPAMVLLFAIVPCYLVIAAFIAHRPLHAPELALDRAIPLVPAWSVVYGSLFCAALLPVFVVHQQELIRRTVLAFIAIWLASYACFVAWPTAAPAHAAPGADSFGGWVLAAIYDSDVRYNCFPSLHVAQCVLAALICSRVHRGVGLACGAWAALVALSTLFVKQHYVVDVVAGAALAWLAHVALVRSYPRDATPAHERALAPILAAGAFALYALVVVGFRIAYPWLA